MVVEVNELKAAILVIKIDKQGFGKEKIIKIK